jgi:hypothetical protein
MVLGLVAAWVVQCPRWEVTTRGVATIGVAVTAALATSTRTALMGGQEDSCSPTTPELEEALAAGGRKAAARIKALQDNP